MPANYMLRKHLRAMESAAKPEAVAERQASERANRLAMADVRTRFQTITPDNFERADNYRRERVAHWRRALPREGETR